MNTTLRLIVITLLVVLLGAGLVLSGVVLARSTVAPNGYSMMGSYGPYGPGNTGMMGGYVGNGYGQPYTGTVPYGGMMNGGMMNGMMTGGMMGGNGSPSLYGIKPLAAADAQAAVRSYLTGLNNADLALDEVIIFDNQAYARVVEKSTGIGAFEVLIDPVTKAVSPEPGPNMMWNGKYGITSGNGTGMMGSNGAGGMMGGSQPATPSNTMPVSAEDAVTTAQHYLDTYLPGAQADKQPDQFYGYYTIEILRDGKIVGMLSVNGYGRQVFVHTWHGNFVEKVEP